MNTVLILSILLTAASLAALWFWLGCRHYEAEIVYLEDVILDADDTLDNKAEEWLSTYFSTLREEAAYIRELREENTTADD